MKQLLFILLVFVAFGLNAQKTKAKNAVKKCSRNSKTGGCTTSHTICATGCP
ncbi:MAG: hypothetical protein IPK35_07075 [Saprospiraceae bacterium]|nr:hypothetical protein [Saprospiraceae bacterium]